MIENESSISRIVQQAAYTAATAPAPYKQSEYSQLGQSNATLARSQNANQLYDGTGQIDDTAKKIPLIYGEVYTKGTIVDSVSLNNPDPVTQDKVTQITQKLIISEGPCEGIIAPKDAGVVLNGLPLVDPTTGRRQRAGVEVVDGHDRTSYTTKMPEVVPANGTSGLQVYESIYSDNGSYVDNTIARNTMRALNDVTADFADEGHILQYNSRGKMWESIHLHDALKNSGMYISTEPVPANTNSTEKWYLPHTDTLVFTWSSTGGRQYTDDGGTLYRPWMNPYGFTEALLVNGRKHPDLVMYAGITYTIDLTGLDSAFSITMDVMTEDGTSSQNAVEPMPGGEIYTIKIPASYNNTSGFYQTALWVYDIGHATITGGRGGRIYIR